MILGNILKSLSGNSFYNYHSLITTKEVSIFPTGTCYPFDRKLFITANGDMLPCERINQKFSLGKVTERGVFNSFLHIFIHSNIFLLTLPYYP